ncbi:MAG: DnaJ domain-containing protein [Deltaproteobacteria bacterium]|nr:DnaJ domain-containing protein [Deltaproteobacteria bacterium]
MKDYYAVLGVPPDATAEEIRRAYRRRAFELHPDRNGGSPEAEEAFKELTEAYAVLADPTRRRSYDAARAGRPTPGGAEFRPEDLFADLFRHPVFGAFLRQMAEEFRRQGLRFDEGYLRRVFHAPGGGVFFGGFVFVGPLGGWFRSFERAPRRFPGPGGRARALPKRPGVLGRILRKALPRPAPPGSVEYRLPVPPEVRRAGGTVEVAVPGPRGMERLRVRIPAGARPGLRLRIRGKGPGKAGNRGDLLLRISDPPSSC